LRDELIERRRITKAVLGLSGGIDSAVVAYLCARALGPENVHAIRMPYRTSSADSLADAQRVVDALGINVETIEITDAVDGYLRVAGDADPRRRGNVMARMRMLVLFDQSARLNALPVGTGNKTERLMGYFTWHADDTPPVNPIGDLYKTQVWALARHLGVPVQVIDKPPSADLEANQTDEGDMGAVRRETRQACFSDSRGEPLRDPALGRHTPQVVLADEDDRVLPDMRESKVSLRGHYTPSQISRSNSAGALRCVSIRRCCLCHTTATRRAPALFLSWKCYGCFPYDAFGLPVSSVEKHPYRQQACASDVKRAGTIARRACHHSGAIASASKGSAPIR